MLQLVCTAIVILACALVVIKGVRAGIERVSKIVLPMLLIVILILMVRSLTLPGAMAGVRWYILKFRFADLTPTVMAAAIGHAIFSLSLGGTFMVVYGSYLDANESLARPAIWTVIGDTGSALLAGFAVIPAVFALGLEPTSGPGLIFATLPKVFAAMPLGGFFGCLFFIGLFGAGYLSDIGAFEVLVAGLTDNTKLYARARGVGGCGSSLRARDSADDQQRDLRSVGPDVRIGDADTRLAGRGARRGLVHLALRRAARARGAWRRAGAGLVVQLDSIRHSGDHRRRWCVVAVVQCVRRGAFRMTAAASTIITERICLFR